MFEVEPFTVVYVPHSRGWPYVCVYVYVMSVHRLYGDTQRWIWVPACAVICCDVRNQIVERRGGDTKLDEMKEYIERERLVWYMTHFVAGVQLDEF